MKVIFLDIDGVLNHAGSAWLDPANLANLARITKAIGCTVVLISSWRTEMHSARMIMFADMLNARGVTISGITPSLNDRNAEIIDYLNRHNDISKFVVIDDENHYRGSKIRKNVFLTIYTEGLTTDIADKIIRVLAEK